MEVAISTTDESVRILEFDSQSKYEMGVPLVPERGVADGSSDLAAVVHFLRQDLMRAAAGYRERLRAAVIACRRNRLIVTRLSETLLDTAIALEGIDGKTIVIAEAASLVQLDDSDARRNLQVAVGVVQVLPAGVYVVAGGRVLPPGRLLMNAAPRP